jgi:hypothetical protein
MLMLKKAFRHLFFMMDPVAIIGEMIGLNLVTYCLNRREKGGQVTLGILEDSHVRSP